MSVPKNVGCKNPKCIKKDECYRQYIYKNNQAVEVKEFGGNEQKGCGKYISLNEELQSNSNAN